METIGYLHKLVGQVKKKQGVFANWTASPACAFVKQNFGVSFSSRGMLNLFERLGLSYTRPTYTLDKDDPRKQEEFRKIFESLKKTAEW